MTDYQCNRCGAALDRPLEQTALYVIADDFREDRDIRVTAPEIARQGYDMGQIRTFGRDVMVRKVGERQAVVVETLDGIADEEIAAVQEVTMAVSLENPGLVCKDCYRPGEDLRIWGTTREEDEEAERQAALERLAAIEEGVKDMS